MYNWEYFAYINTSISGQFKYNILPFELILAWYVLNCLWHTWACAWWTWTTVCDGHLSISIQIYVTGFLPAINVFSTCIVYTADKLNVSFGTIFRFTCSICEQHWFTQNVSTTVDLKRYTITITSFVSWTGKRLLSLADNRPFNISRNSLR